MHKIITDFTEASGGLVGPHTFYAFPGRMMITALSNNADSGGRTGMAEYNNEGEYITTHWIPTDSDLRGATKTGNLADGYGYDVRVKADQNIMLTSSFTGWSNYMMDFGQMVGSPDAMQRFGNTMVVWDMHARKPLKVLDVPGAPLEIRCAWGEGNNYCFTSTALTSQIWLIYPDENGEWQAKAVSDIGVPADIPLPVDISITADNQGLWVDTFLEGKTRYFDISDPHAPKQVYEEVIGSQINMVSQSWDGKRVYFSSSLLGNWDKTGDADEQYVKLYHWNGESLEHKWTVDFYEQGLGRAH
jgi:selenium-binding protein 1